MGVADLLITQENVGVGLALLELFRLKEADLAAVTWGAGLNR